MRYKVLIADDEETIRHGMIKLIQKDESLEIVAEAEDGEIALDMAYKYLPDILLVDINMPFIDGLELVAKLNETLKNSIVIVITGYDKFEYTQAALRLNVSDYLLKPLSQEALFTSIENAKLKIQKRNQEEKYLEWAKSQIRKYRSVLSAEFVGNWLMGRLSIPEVEYEAEKLEMAFPKGECGLISFNMQIESFRSMEEWDEQLLYYAAENITREIFADFAPLLTAKIDGCTLALISSIEPIKAWQQQTVYAKKALQQYLPLKVFSISKICADWKYLPELFDSITEEYDQIIEVSSISNEIREYIETHYSDVDFSLKEIANKMFMSPQYLSRIFKREMGVTFMDYVTRLRIRRAIELLSKNDLKMYEIAEAIGYSNQHYFSSSFRKMLGVSPMEYRRRLRKKNNRRLKND